MILPIASRPKVGRIPGDQGDARLSNVGSRTIVGRL